MSLSLLVSTVAPSNNTDSYENKEWSTVNGWIEINSIMAVMYFILSGVGAYMYLKRYDKKAALKRISHQRAATPFAYTLTSTNTSGNRTHLDVADNDGGPDYVSRFFLIMLWFAVSRCAMFLSLALLSQLKNVTLFNAGTMKKQRIQNLITFLPTFNYAWMCIYLLFLWKYLLSVATHGSYRRALFLSRACIGVVFVVGVVFAITDFKQVTAGASVYFFMVTWGIMSLCFLAAGIILPNRMRGHSEALHTSAGRVRRTALWFAAMFAVHVGIIFSQARFGWMKHMFLPLFFLVVEYIPTVVALLSLHVPESEVSETNRRRQMRMYGTY